VADQLHVVQCIERFVYAALCYFSTYDLLRQFINMLLHNATKNVNDVRCYIVFETELGLRVNVQNHKYVEHRRKYEKLCTILLLLLSSSSSSSSSSCVSSSVCAVICHLRFPGFPLFSSQ
jgi:hypothetical protein